MSLKTSFENHSRPKCPMKMPRKYLDILMSPAGKQYSVGISSNNEITIGIHRTWKFPGKKLTLGNSTCTVYACNMLGDGPCIESV